MMHVCKQIFLTLTAVVFISLFSSCGVDQSVTIAEQYGLAYAPLQIMRHQGYLEQLEPELEVKWVKLGNTAAIREAVLSGDVDFGFMGLPPFLIGADKGMDWKMVTGLSICPVGLVAGESITDFDSLGPEHRIALPQPGSIQHILLSMACERKYNDAARFDNRLITMKHPDGMAALLSGAVDAHFTSPPYIFMEEAAKAPDGSGFRTVLSGFEAFGGDFTFIGAAASGNIIKNKSGLLQNFLKAVEMSIDFINTRPEAAAAILADIYQMDKTEILAYISRDDMKYTSELVGFERFISFMIENSYISDGMKAEDVVYK